MSSQPNVCLFTVPHSGTRFTMQYFLHIGWFPWSPKEHDERFLYWQQHSGVWVDNAPEDALWRLQNRKVVITVQHPHRCWVSFLSRNKTFEQNIHCWKSLLEWMPRLDYVLFDINCSEDKRKEQLVNVLRHVGQYTEESDKLTEDFVNNKWIPAHPKDSQFKNDYLSQGKLPDGYDYNKLQFAVDWYESLPSNDY